MDFKHRITHSSKLIRDDRGNLHRVRLANKRDRDPALSVDDQAVWDEYRRIIRGFGNPISHALVSGSCFVLAGAFAISGFSDPSRSWLYLGGAGMLIYVGVRNPGWIRKKRNRFAARLAACKACVACSYLLADLPTEPDGCTVCPECGAAWLSSVPNRDGSAEGPA